MLICGSDVELPHAVFAAGFVAIFTPRKGTEHIYIRSPQFFVYPHSTIQLCHTLGQSSKAVQVGK